MHRITPVKDSIISLMSDGKPRTLTDVCLRLKRNGRSLRNATSITLKNMTAEEILTCDFDHGIAIWQINKSSSAHGTS